MDKRVFFTILFVVGVGVYATVLFQLLLQMQQESTVVVPASNVSTSSSRNSLAGANFKFQLSTVNRQSSTVNSQLSTVNSQLSTVNSQFSILNSLSSARRVKSVGGGYGLAPMSSQPARKSTSALPAVPLPVLSTASLSTSSLLTSASTHYVAVQQEASAPARIVRRNLPAFPLDPGVGPQFPYEPGLTTCGHCVDDGTGHCRFCGNEMTNCLCDSCRCPIDDDAFGVLPLLLMALAYACKKRSFSAKNLHN